MLWSRKSLLKKIGYTEERAKLERVNTLKVRGIKFLIRALAPFDFVDQQRHPFWMVKDEGGKLADKTRQREFMALDLTKAENVTKAAQQMADAYRPVLLKGVLWPKVSEDEAEGTIPVTDLFVDMAVASKLYTAIMDISISGKKKSLFISLLQRLSNWTLSRRGTGVHPMRLPGTTTETTASMSKSGA